MNNLYTGTFNISLNNKNGLLDQGKGYGLDLVYTDSLKKKHTIMVDYKHFGNLPDMKEMNVLVSQINVKHSEGYFDKTLDIYFGVNQVEDKTVTTKKYPMIVHGERIFITEETFKKTCEDFSKSSQGCIDEIVNGDVYCNPDFKTEHLNDLAINRDEWLTYPEQSGCCLAFWQRAYYIQYGVSVPVLS